MEKEKKNQFYEIPMDEVEKITGGFVIAVVAVGTATYTITSGMVLGAIGGAYALGQTAYEIHNAFN